MRRARWFILSGLIAGLNAAPLAADMRDGRHDFDFNSGTWHTHVKRILDPFSDPGKTLELDGTVSVSRIWDGGWLEEIEADGPGGHWQAMTLFLYDPRSGQWSQSYINAKYGTLSAPSIGAFKDGRGELFSQDIFKDRTVIVRGVWSNISANAHSFAEDYSDDGGKSWKPAFIANLTRIDPKDAIAPAEGRHDFDWELGKWSAHAARLVHPLTGSKDWEESEGVVEVRKIWGGSANLAKVHLERPGRITDFFALRWYDANARQWHLNFAPMAGGELGPVSGAGEFKDGRIDFHSQEMIDGRSVMVRLSLWPTSATTMHSEQAFSADGGKSWETNYKTDYKRAGDG